MSNTEALRAACAAMLAALDGMADRDDAGGLMPWAGYLGPYDGTDYGAALDAATADARAALAQTAASGEPAEDAEAWLLARFGVVRGHPEWRALTEAFNAGKTAAQPAPAPAALAKSMERECTDPQACTFHRRCLGKCCVPLVNANTALKLRATDARAAPQPAPALVPLTNAKDRTDQGSSYIEGYVCTRALRAATEAAHEIAAPDAQKEKGGP